MNTSSKLTPIRVTIIGEHEHNKCPRGFKAGDTWLIKDGKTPDGMCMSAYHTMYQYLWVFRYGGKHPWDMGPGYIRLGCPEPPHLVYELRTEKTDELTTIDSNIDLDTNPFKDSMSFSTEGFDPIRITVASVKGKCPLGNKVGDSWMFDGKTPAGMCPSAYNALFPTLRVFRFNGTLPWQKESGLVHVACPDTYNRLVYELKVMKKN